MSGVVVRGFVYSRRLGIVLDGGGTQNQTATEVR
jgi:hypothetical protein